MKRLACYGCASLMYFFLLSANSSNAFAQNKTLTVEYPQNGVDIGDGWDLFANKKTTGRCVTYTKRSETGQLKTVDIESVSDKSSLMNSWHISAEAQLKAIVAKGSARADFAESTTIQTENTNFSVRALVKNGPIYTGPDASGRIDIAPQFRHMEPKLFRKICGDAFVSTKYGGAELDAVVQLTKLNLYESKTLKSSAQGSVGILAMNASLDTAMKRASEQNTLTIRSRESGGSGDTLPTDQAGLNTTIQNLAKAAQDSPAFFQIEITPYSALPSWIGVIGNARAVGDIDKITLRFGELQSLRDEVELMITNPTAYILDRGVSIQNLHDLDDELLAHVQRLKSAAGTCDDSQGVNCTIDPRDDINDYTFRARLPISRIDFGYDEALEALQKALAVNTTVLSQTSFFDTASKKSVLNSRQILIRNIKDMQAHYPDALRWYIGEKWIASVKRERCKADATSIDCINDKQADQYISSIHTQ